MTTSAQTGLLDDAIAAAQEGRRDEAGRALWGALKAAAAVADAGERRQCLRRTAQLAGALGFDDLALLAWEDAGRVAVADDAAADASDAIDCANVHFRLGNVAEAEKRFRQAIGDCVALGDFANAASASTNLAGILADAGDFGGARELLNASLDYVAREPFPDTELNTRLTLIQVLEALEADPTEILEVAAPLAAFAGVLEGQARTVVAGVVQRTLARQGDDADVRAAEFSWLFG